MTESTARATAVSAVETPRPNYLHSSPRLLPHQPIENAAIVQIAHFERSFDDLQGRLVPVDRGLPATGDQLSPRQRKSREHRLLVVRSLRVIFQPLLQHRRVREECVEDRGQQSLAAPHRRDTCLIDRIRAISASFNLSFSRSKSRLWSQILVNPTGELYILLDISARILVRRLRHGPPSLQFLMHRLIRFIAATKK